MGETKTGAPVSVPEVKTVEVATASGKHL